MKKQNIEDIFSSMENFSSVPPPELWANIEEKLDKPKKKKRAILWWSAAACLLLGLLLPSVLYFSSNTGIKTLNNGNGANNSIVIDGKNKEANATKVIATDEKNNEKNAKIATGSSEKNPKDKFNNPKENVLKETAVADADSRNRENNASTTKLNSENTDIKQTIAKKTAESEAGNQFNSYSQNKNLNTEKRNTNQALASKNYMSKNQQSFDSAEKNQFSPGEKRNADKALAEKTFTAGKQKQFNSFSTQQAPNSIFENQANSNSGSIALGTSNSVLTAKQATDNKKDAVTATTTKRDKIVADNTSKSNSNFSTVLSKQDSVQLAELQNLEKGILPEVKKGSEKKPKTSSTAEKWALEVFAGIANSENYKNDKTLGNVNDSKQSSTYGVKTKYKINKKWAVGSGFKVNELGQSVANVSYIKTANNAFLTTGDYFIQNSTVPKIASNDGYVLVSNSTKNALTSNNVQSGSLDQSLRYVEMPLEVSYAVFSRNKASISLNTGGFVGKLISNSVAIDGNSLGKNINANDFVYGSTLSSTVQYRVYKKTNVFVEPAVNYYVNPLNNQSFNQFQWGLNFGLNVSF